MSRLKDRGVKARVTQQFQLIGLEVATALKDFAHRAIYIKYAKELGSDRVLALAKDIASRRDVKNHAAYFMKMIQEEVRSKKHEVSKKDGPSHP